MARIWPHLPADAEAHILSFLSPNDVACIIRPINKATAKFFNGPEHITVHLSQPVPEDAFAVHWQPASSVWRDLSFGKRYKTLCLTASAGILPNLVLAVEGAGCVLAGEMMQDAAAAGRLHICQWLRQQGCPWGAALASAAKAGRQEVLDWLLANGCSWDSDLWSASHAITAAARASHVSLLELLLHQAPALCRAPAQMQQHLEAVAEGCDLATLQRLLPAWPGLVKHEAWEPPVEEGVDQFERRRVLASAARSPTPDWQAKVQWLEAQGYPRTVDACAEVAGLPDALDRLVWLRQRAYPVDDLAIYSAASAGNAAALESMLVPLLQEGVFQAEDFAAGSLAGAAAARGGHLPTLELLHTHSCLSFRPPAQGAAEAGHLHVVVWLVETFGASVEEMETAGLMDAAASSGSVELLAWLRQRGCGLGGSVFDNAACSGCEAALEWLVAQGCPVPDHGNPYAVAAQHGDLATFRWLRDHGCPWGPCCTFPEHHYLNDLPWRALRWLVKAGCPVKWEAARNFADNVVRGGRCGRRTVLGVEGAAWLLEEYQRRGAAAGL